MPEVVIPDKYADQVPRFTLPKEFNNDAPEVKPEVKKEVIPAEPPKEEAKPPATEAVATEGEPPEETTEKDPEKASTRRFERRIDRAHRRAAEAQAKAEVLERELTELRAKQAPQAVNAPKMEDFTDVQEYAKAYANFEKGNAVKEYEQKQRDAVINSRRVKLEQDWEAKVSKASAKYEDFDEVVGELKPTTPWAVALMKAENGADIAHYLGSHQAEARKIFALDPYDQIREIGKLEVKLTAPEKPKTPSKAPAPIEPVASGGGVGATEIEPNQPYETYRKIGNKMFRGR